MQPDSARPNWLGGDPVLAPCLPSFFFYSSLGFCFSLHLPVYLRHSHTVRRTQHINMQAEHTLPLFASTLCLLCCSKRIAVAIILRLLFPFFLPRPTLFVSAPSGQILSHDSCHQGSFHSSYLYILCPKHRSL